MDSKKTIIVFNSSRAAIKADNFSEQMNLNTEVIAVPESISSECGMALSVDEKDIECITNYLQDNKIDYNIHKI